MSATAAQQASNPRQNRAAGAPLAPSLAMTPGPQLETALSAKRRPPIREAATMIERLGPKCALGTDGRQWIVYRRGGGADDILWQGEPWAADGYIHSDKRALINCLRAKNLELSEAGRAALDRQDAKIWRWRR